MKMLKILAVLAICMSLASSTVAREVSVKPLDQADVEAVNNSRATFTLAIKTLLPG